MLVKAALLLGLLQEANLTYRLPFEDGKTYALTQGNEGTLSHTGYCRFAFDFGMPEGTKIAAARGGKVIVAKEDIEKGGTSGGNQVKIDHGDGSVGVYFHLRHEGALVEVGDVVLQGDIIALSGATGNVTGPHLHFQVDRASTSSPVAFEDVETDAGVPQPGKSYTSKNTPGISAEVKNRLQRLSKAAKLAEEEGSWGLAYLAHRKFAEERLAVKYAPQDVARRRLGEIAAKAEEAAQGTDPLALLLARIAFEGVPSKALATASAGVKDPEAKSRAWAWEKYYKGLKDEIEGRWPAARTAYKGILSNKPDEELRRRTEARLAAVEAHLKELLAPAKKKA